MNVLRQADAIVYFRMLRSVGHFFPVKGSRKFVFCPCTCNAKNSKTEKLPNGLPEPILKESLGGIVNEFCRELGTLCENHLPRPSQT